MMPQFMKYKLKSCKLLDKKSRIKIKSFNPLKKMPLIQLNRSKNGTTFDLMHLHSLHFNV